MGALLMWCLIQVLHAAPLVAAYYFGRWSQRRDAKR